jgi:hypothetical protein
MTTAPRRKACRLPIDHPCQSVGKRGLCGFCMDMTANAERMKKKNADPAFAAANAERMKKRHADPTFAAAHAERMKKLHADPAFAAANAERARELMKKRHAAWRALKVAETKEITE